jgi:hypothetical protein
MSSFETPVAVVGNALRRHSGAVAAAWALTFVAAVALLLAFADRPPIVRDANLVPTEGFETGLAPWDEYDDGLLERSTAVSRTGDASARVAASEFDDYGLEVYGGVVRPRPGEVYAFSVWLRGEGAAVGNRVLLQMNEHGGTLEEITDRPVAILRTVVRGDWTKVSIAGTVLGDGRDSLDLFVVVEDPRSVGEALYVDDVSLVRLRAAPAGEDGR